MTKPKLPKAPKAAKRASRIERADAAVATALAQHRDSPPMRALAVAGEAADQPPLFAAGAGVLALGLVLRRPRLARTGARMLATMLVATAIKGAIKHHVHRTRPNKMLADGRYVLRHDPKGERDEGPWNSFPSGHTSGAVGVARAVVREYPAAAPVATAAASAAAAIQVPTGAHFPSDVAAGTIVGLVSEALVDGAIRLVERALDRGRARR